MLKEKTFRFSQEGFNQAKEYSKFKEVKGTVLNTLEEHPQIVPLAIAFSIGVASALIPMLGSTVAFKASEEVSMVAFKYVSGGF